MSYLLVGDLHLTDRPRDAYRFGIFDWIQQQQTIHEPDATFLLGDITDQKDRHSALLVNKVVEGLKSLEKDTFIVKGNHDYTDPTNPFFGFLNFMENLYFISNPEIVLGSIAIIPHVRDEKLMEKNCAALSEHDPKMLLLHNTFQGAIAETGSPLNGFSASPIRQMALKLGCYAGDVHKPQVVSPVIYVGSPYNIRFGDDFDPRCLLVHNNGRITNLYFNAPRKWKLDVTDPEDIRKDVHLRKGDHVKIRIELLREEAIEWQSYRSRIATVCHELGLELFGLELHINNGRISPADTNNLSSKSAEDVVVEFCKKEKTSSTIKEIGLRLLNV